MFHSYCCATAFVSMMINHNYSIPRAVKICRANVFSYLAFANRFLTIFYPGRRSHAISIPNTSQASRALTRKMVWSRILFLWSHFQAFWFCRLCFKVELAIFCRVMNSPCFYHVRLFLLFFFSGIHATASLKFSGIVYVSHLFRKMSIVVRSFLYLLINLHECIFNIFKFNLLCR